MTNALTINNYISFFIHNKQEAGPSTYNQLLNNRVNIMNRFDVTIKTKGAIEKYHIEEIDGRYTISKLSRSFFGTKSYKKIAETKSQEDALNMLRILTPNQITTMEIEPCSLNYNWYN